ncbi:MAG TPA: fused MFS/spermidine synthase [Candidatus Dormibacteraeota bacterium]|nr:fused MFS/spermidine synthase [Candidatus Dormibacteraeota bacterium]
MGRAAESKGRTPAGNSARRQLLYGCFFASGAAGLILEVVWSKYLSFLLGNSIYGVSTVVAAFLGGLGIGASLGGRLAARTREPLLLYARLELIVAVMGLSSPLAYLAARPIFASLNALFLGHGAAFLFLRFLVLFAALLVPTIAMGASLPLLVSDFARRDARGSAGAVARLYAVNTAGAVAGVAAAGFLAIPALGLWKTAALAAAIDVAVVVAILLARPPAPLAAAREGIVAEPARDARGPRSQVAPHGVPAFARWILPVFAISGFTAILYEVAWTRILAVPFGGMVYAFSAILAIYLVGIALGASAAARLLRYVKAPIALFGVLQGVLAAAAALGSRLFERIPHWEATAIAASMGSTWRLLLGEVGIAARIILPASLALGALFPTAVAVYQLKRREAGASVGTIYAANTIGSIAGSLLTAFLLIPWIGTLRSILLAAGLNAAIGIAALLAGEGRPILRRSAAAVLAASAAAFATLAVPTWDAERMSLGLIRLLRSHWYGGESLTHRTIDAIGRSTKLERLLFYKEGRAAAVTVIESGGRRALLINGKTDATTGVGEDMAQQVLVGQLPLLMLGDNGKDVCVVGYGSGVTTHAVLTHPIRDALTIELEEAVIEAAPQFRADAGEPLADPRSRLLIEDAGTYLRSTRRAYDVIISEPSNLWIAGMADLFTRDFYRTAASKLRPGGIFCQWVQCYQTSPATLQTIFRTLAVRFPHGQLFFVDKSADLIILASPDRDVPLDLDRLAEAWARPEVARDFARVGVESLADLLRYYRGRLDRVAAEAGPGPINTDDNGWLEHRAPFDLLAGATSEHEMAWSPDVAADLAASIVSDRDRAAPLLDDAGRRAKAAGNEGAVLGLKMARERMTRGK